LENLETGLQRKEKTVKNMDFLRKAIRASRTLKVQKGSNQKKNAGNTVMG